MYELRRHIYGNSIDRITIKKFVGLVFPDCRCKELNEKHLNKGACSQKEVDTVEGDENYKQSLSDDEIEMYFSENIDQIISDETEDEKKLTKGIKRNNTKTNNTFPINHNRSCKIPSRGNVNIKAVAGELYCAGHRIALPVESTILALNMPEENIDTLMSYLELHPRRYLQILNPLRSSCTVQCYGGAEQFHLLARKFPPVALAVRQLPNYMLKELNEMRQIDLDLCEIADLMNWNVLTVAREIRSLQWNMAYALDVPLNTSGKSGIIIESENLSFHILTAENMTDEHIDDVIDFLHDSVKRQEKTRLLQLDALYNVLKDLSCHKYYELPKDKCLDVKAKECISTYFLCYEKEQTELLEEFSQIDMKTETSSRKWNIIASDIRNLINSYPDEEFTGRAVARIFQGIDSPCYRATIYGRDRRFWRQHLDTDFNELRLFATEELQKFRS